MFRAPISENVLNAYQSYTYNFKLYAVDPVTHSKIVQETIDYEDIHKVSKNATKKAIIVESAVTNMMIDDLSITSLPSTTESIILNKLSFKVTQPKGFSFMESVVAAGLWCGWKSFMSNPFLILEIEFKGWRYNNSKSTDEETIRKISLPIQISKINTELDIGGTRYSIDAAILFNWSRQVYSTTMATLSVSHCVTFGDFLRKLETAMNEESQKDQSRNDIDKTLHRFEADDELAKIKLNSINNEKNLLYNIPAGSEPNDVQGASFTIPNQMTIPKILESVLIASEEMQKKYRIDDEEAFFGESFQIDPTVKIKEFNFAMGEYTYDIIWKIRLVPTPLIRNVSNKNINNKSIDYINNSEFVKFRKVYQHYYTGENSEVLSTNIDLNNLFFNKVARYKSLFSTEANHGGNIKGDTSTNEETKESLKHASENPELKAKGLDVSKGQTKFQNRNSTDGVLYVDNFDDSMIKTLTSQRFLYRFARDTQSSVPQKTGTDAAETKSQDVADELRNIRNQLHLSAMRLTLDIKGDPYWLTPIHASYEENSFERLSNIKTNYIGFITGFPNEVQEKGVRNDYVFSGIYQVISIVSSFNSGKFTQKLDCKRFPHMESDTFIKNFYNRGG